MSLITYVCNLTIKSPDSSTNSNFGWSLSFHESENRLAIGASKYSPNGRGMAFYYIFQSGQWKLASKLDPSITLPDNSLYGDGVDFSSDKIFISEPKTKRVWLFSTGSSTVNSYTSSLTNFGESISLDRAVNLAAVAAWGSTTIQILNVSTSSLSTALQVTGSGGEYGRSVKLTDKFLFVGAPNTKPGYVFIYSVPGFRLVQNITAPSSIVAPSVDGKFGKFITAYDKYLLVSATGSSVLKSFVFLYNTSSSSWVYHSVYQPKSFASKLSKYGEAIDIYPTSTGGYSILVGDTGCKAGVPSDKAPDGLVSYFNYECSNNTYGLTCNNTCSCKNGVCSTGLYGTGKCLSCFPGYFGPNCTKCLCNTSGGVCNDTLTGNGECTSCSPNYFGKYCAPCYCQNGVCNGTITGNGVCTSCHSNYWGKNCTDMCQNCSTSCYAGINGNGTCSPCNKGTYSSSCFNCSCERGICNEGPDGDGLCLSCDANVYGKNCSNNCSCVNGICNDGPDGDGSCTCPEGYYGKYCESMCLCDATAICRIITIIDPNTSSTTYDSVCDCDSTHYGKYCNLTCPCQNGVCNNTSIDGSSSGGGGNGECTVCNNSDVTVSFYGPYCMPCLCENGECNAGITGDGACNRNPTSIPSSCISYYYGIYCNNSCDPTCSSLGISCFDGIDGNGTCYCPIDTGVKLVFNGTGCQEVFCYDGETVGSWFVCQNNTYVSNQTVVVPSGTTLVLPPGNYIINGDFIINSNFTGDTTNISVTGKTVISSDSNTNTSASFQGTNLVSTLGISLGSLSINGSNTQIILSGNSSLVTLNDCFNSTSQSSLVVYVDTSALQNNTEYRLPINSNCYVGSLSQLSIIPVGPSSNATDNSTDGENLSSSVCTIEKKSVANINSILTVVFDPTLLSGPNKKCNSPSSTTNTSNNTIDDPWYISYSWALGVAAGGILIVILTIGCVVWHHNKKILKQKQSSIKAKHKKFTFSSNGTSTELNNRV
eukprot:TRINITY_DN2169_c0_g1_i3.p1 TRINITY_DN2169_c0_g1~~TRINITY_DN2169_c0_g1_i3.p1  ORF type:complete len:989 (+),score=176.59 TRINITY_DN2169_c0_g1_i3:244-3210(+)